MMEKTQYEARVLPFSSIPTHDSTMATPGKLAQSFHILDHAGTNWIQVDVAHKLKQIRFLLAEEGLIPVLKEVAGTALPPVELLGISGEQTSHDVCDGRHAGSEKERGVFERRANA